MAVILATWETEMGRIVVWGQSGQIVCETPISKLTRAIEYLLCMCEALGSNPSLTKKQKQKQKKVY
jgi:hypothetical protein